MHAPDAPQLMYLADLVGCCLLSTSWLLYHGWTDRGHGAVTGARAMVAIGFVLFATAVGMTLGLDALTGGALAYYLGDLTLLTGSYLGIGAGTMVAGMILADKAARGGRSPPLPAGNRLFDR